MLAGGKALQNNRPQRNARQAHDLVSELGQHAPDFAFPPLGKNQLERGCFPLGPNHSDVPGANLAVGEPNSFGELCECLTAQACLPPACGMSFQPRSADGRDGLPARRRWSKS